MTSNIIHYNCGYYRIILDNRINILHLIVCNKNGRRLSSGHILSINKNSSLRQESMIAFNLKTDFRDKVVLKVDNGLHNLTQEDSHGSRI